MKAKLFVLFALLSLFFSGCAPDLPAPVVPAQVTQAQVAQPANAPLLEAGKFIYRPDLSLNPALIPGSGDDWDRAFIESGDIVKVGDIYYWYYHGHKDTYQIGVATATDPTGPAYPKARRPRSLSVGRARPSGRSESGIYTPEIRDAPIASFV